MSNKVKDKAMKSAETGKLVPKLRFPEFRNAGDWKEEKLDDLVCFQDGFAFKSTDFVKSKKDAVQVIRITDVNNKNSNEDKVYVPDAFLESDNLSKYTVNNGDLLLSLTGAAGFNFFFWDGGRAVINQRTAKVTPKKKSDYALARLLEPLIYEAINSRGEGQNNNLSKEFLSSIMLLIPKPAEQQKIADCLSSVDELITLEAQKLDTLKTHKKGLMQQLFPVEGETVPKLRFPEFRSAGGWEKIPIGKIGEIVTGNTPSTTVTEYYGGDRLFVSPADMADHRFIYNTKTTLTELGYSKTRQIPAGSVLFVCIGSTIGKVAQNKIDCATNQQINAVVPFENYSSGFIYYSLDLNASNIAELAGKQAVPIINKTVFSTVVLDLPMLNEQQLIAECLSSLDELISAQNEKLEALKTHKKGLMQQLFPSAGGVPV